MSKGMKGARYQWPLGQDVWFPYIIMIIGGVHYSYIIAHTNKFTCLVWFGLVWLYDDLSPRRLSTFTRLSDSVTVHPALYPKCVGAQPLWGSSSPSITLLSYVIPYILHNFSYFTIVPYIFLPYHHTSKQRFICRSRIPTPGCQSMRKCVEVYSMKKLHNTCMKNTCKNWMKIQ